MSRHTVSSIIELEDGFDYGEVAYGFDHATGPFFQRFDGEDELVEDIDYLFSGRQFDCHALAEKLQAMLDAGEIDPAPPLPQHIATLWMDLPI